MNNTSADRHRNVQDGLLIEKTFRNNEFSDFSKIIATFLAGQIQRASHACFGVAGPVRANRVQMTNLDWLLDGPALAATFGMDEVLLVNDLVATTAGALVLPEENLITLHTGRADKTGSIGVLALGTGLGQSFAVPGDNQSGNQLQPFPTEGGHSSFAPRNQEQIELLQFMLARSGQLPSRQSPHVSVEQVCSGMALPDLYAFQLSRCQEPERMREKRLAAEPHALTPLIVEAANTALDGGLPCEPAVRTIRLLFDILAAEAANLALKVLATGGIFLGGGMLPRLLPHIDQKRFIHIFSRGVYKELLEDIPVHIITEPKTALIGARQLAAKIIN
ncbi:MAG: glucokinase [Candidatus Electrothrix sp. ATG2]|nr:glucokinase [Candidatus Electrothrix sp. ATG2]